MTMQQMVDAVLRVTSPAELRYMQSGDVSVAVWLAERALDLSPSQAESVALRIVEQLAVSH